MITGEIGFAPLVSLGYFGAVAFPMNPWPGRTPSLAGSLGPVGRPRSAAASPARVPPQQETLFPPRGLREAWLPSRWNFMPHLFHRKTWLNQRCQIYLEREWKKELVLVCAHVCACVHACADASGVARAGSQGPVRAIMRVRCAYQW